MLLAINKFPEYPEHRKSQSRRIGAKWFKRQHVESWPGETDFHFPAQGYVFRNLRSELPSVPVRLSPLTKGTCFSKAVFNLSTLVRRLGAIRALLNIQSQLQWWLIFLHHYLAFANMKSTEIFELKFGNCYQILTIICSQISVIFSRAWLLLSLCISSVSDIGPSLLVQPGGRDSSQCECLAINHCGKKKTKQKTNNPKPTIFPPWLRFAASLSRWKVICDSRGSGGSHRMNLLSHAPLPCCSLSCTWELFKPESRGRGQGLHTQQCKSHWKKSTMWHYTVWFPFEASYCQASENKDSRETPLKLSKVVGFLTLKSGSSWAERLTLPSLFVLVVLQVALGLTQCSSSRGRRSLPALWEGEANIKILLGGILEQSLPFFKNPVVRNL